MKTILGSIVVIGVAIILAFFLFNRTFFFGWITDLTQSETEALLELRNNYATAQLQLDELRGRLQRFESAAAQVKSVTQFQQYLLAEVYSEYPFTNERRLVIDAGEAMGVGADMPVLAAVDLLVGRVIKANGQTSEVMTIFDPEWREPVRIGQARVDAIVVGGHEPMLDFIDKKADIAVGDFVKNVSARYPSHLFVGRVGEILDDPSAPFKKARLELSYGINDLQDVLVVTNYAATIRD